MIRIFNELRQTESLYLINDEGNLLPDVIKSEFSRIDIKPMNMHCKFGS